MSQALRGHRGLRHRQQRAARPRRSRLGDVCIHLDLQVVRALLHCVGHIPTIGLERPRAHLFSVERDVRIVVHIGDLQIHMLPFGLGGRGELQAVGGRASEGCHTQLLPRLNRRGQLLAVEIQLPVAVEVRQCCPVRKGRLRCDGNPLGQWAHHDHLCLIGPEHQRNAAPNRPPQPLPSWDESRRSPCPSPAPGRVPRWWPCASPPCRSR